MHMTGQVYLCEDAMYKEIVPKLIPFEIMRTNEDSASTELG